MIELREGRYFKAFFTFEFRAGKGFELLPSPKRNGNVLGAIYTDDHKTWHMVYRFRYYIDEVMDHTSEDEKHWFSFTTDGPIEEIWPETKGAFERLALIAESELFVSEPDSESFDDQLAGLQKLPNMNVTVLDKSKPKTSGDYGLN